MEQTNDTVFIMLDKIAEEQGYARDLHEQFNPPK